MEFLPAPQSRVRILSTADVKMDTEQVVYLMTSARRTRFSFALEHALRWSSQLRLPLLVVDVFSPDPRWASRRHVQFVADGMEDVYEEFSKHGITYHPFIEGTPQESSGLLHALEEKAAIIITDDVPQFFQPIFIRDHVGGAGVRIEAIDGNGLLPGSTVNKAYPSAVTFRRCLQKNLRPHIDRMPLENPLSQYEIHSRASLPPSFSERWPSVGPIGRDQASLLSDFGGPDAVAFRGGQKTARHMLELFLRTRLADYDSGRSHPDLNATSSLSSYLHFGHISPHEIFATLMVRQRWTPDLLSHRADGRRSGWWGVSASAEAFLDQFIIWRELGFNMFWNRPDADRYDSLPPWALATLAAHAGDPREHIYTIEEFSAAETHDEVWNSAQRQLVVDGTMHNYLRMLWGKKILEWTREPREALTVLEELNNRYALDGHDPNSYSGIFWVLGRYDRPWAPERPVFGRVRSMSTERALKKLRMAELMRRFTGTEQNGIA